MAEIVALRDAVGALIHDGDSVALEGFTHLIPFAAGHEVIRQQRRGLTLIRMTPDVIYDQLIGAGCATRLIFSWGGNPGVGSLHRLRDAVEHGWPQPLELDEHSHAGLASAAGESTTTKTGRSRSSFSMVGPSCPEPSLCSSYQTSAPARCSPSTSTRQNASSSWLRLTNTFICAFTCSPLRRAALHARLQPHSSITARVGPTG